MLMIIFVPWTGLVKKLHNEIFKEIPGLRLGFFISIDI